MKPKEWIKDKELKTETLRRYFEQFKETATKLGLARCDNAIRIEHEGQVFYWLSEEYIPIIRND